jgi:hypothetical protein
MGNNEDKFFTDWEETFDSFDQMGLHENLLRGIYAYGECTQRGKPSLAHQLHAHQSFHEHAWGYT